MNLSERILKMQASPIRFLTPYADEAKARGKKVYHLNIGQPDIKTPSSFFEAVSNYKEEVLSYTDSRGIPLLLEAMSEYFKKYSLDFAPSDLLVTFGGSEALLMSFISICDPGDELLVPEPYYTNYNGFAQAVSVKITPITTKAEEGFHLPPKEKIEALISPKTKAFLFSNPSNPTGTIYSKEELASLVELAVKHDLFIISDESYREFCYDGLTYFSPAHFPEVRDRVVICDSISKRFSACGARVGCVATHNKDLIANALKYCQSRLCVATLEQVGAAALYKTPPSYFKDVAAEYQHRRDVFHEGLSKMKGVLCRKPQGAFYEVAKLPVDDAEKFAIWMLRDFEYEGATVMVAPASGFYATSGIGRDEVRLAYVLKEENLRRALATLEKGLENYPNRKD